MPKTSRNLGNSNVMTAARRSWVIVGVAALLVTVGGAAWAQSFSVPTMLGFSRSVVLTGNIGRTSNTAMLRSRDDYPSVFAMVAEETRIISAEAEALRAYNDSAATKLTTSLAELDALREVRTGARLAQAAQMRKRTATDKVEVAERLQQAENELTTTENLRELALDEGAPVAAWRAEVEKLRVQRDQLRMLLEQVTALNDSLR